MASFKADLRLLLPLASATVIACSTIGGAAAAITPHLSAKRAATKGATITRRPSRIVSLSATTTEDLYAVGAGKQVVAVDADSTYPPRAPRTKLSGFTPNVEAIAKYRPDLVVLSNDTNHVVAQLKKLHVRVLLAPPATNLAGVYAQIGQIGRTTGHAAKANHLVAKMKRQVRVIVRSVPRPTKPLSIYHELTTNYYSATSHTFIGQMYKLLGLQNIADKAGGSSDYPQLSAEYVIASNPDLIVLADSICCGQNLATVAARSGWSNIAAVRSGAVVPVDDSIASRWGPRVVVFLKKVASAVKRLQGQSR